MPRARRGEKAAPAEEPALGISADDLTAICEVRHAASTRQVLTLPGQSGQELGWNPALGPWEHQVGLLLLGRHPGAVKQQALLQPRQKWPQLRFALQLDDRHRPPVLKQRIMHRPGTGRQWQRAAVTAARLHVRHPSVGHDHPVKETSSSFQSFMTNRPRAMWVLHRSRRTWHSRPRCAAAWRRAHTCSA